jgi:hypothetical protein
MGGEKVSEQKVNGNLNFEQRQQVAELPNLELAHFSHCSCRGRGMGRLERISNPGKERLGVACSGLAKNGHRRLKTKMISFEKLGRET